MGLTLNMKIELDDNSHEVCMAAIIAMVAGAIILCLGYGCHQYETTERAAIKAGLETNGGNTRTWTFPKSTKLEAEK